MKSWIHPTCLFPGGTSGTKRLIYKFLFLLTYFLSPFLFIYFSQTEYQANKKKLPLKERLAVLFEVQVRKILIKLKYQNFLISNLKF